MSGNEPLKEEEDHQCCSMMIGGINISLGVSFKGVHVYEEVMHEASREEAKFF
jgi:hypothetical protein